jgi:hypothetical protein
MKYLLLPLVVLHVVLFILAVQIVSIDGHYRIKEHPYDLRSRT